MTSKTLRKDIETHVEQEIKTGKFPGSYQANSTSETPHIGGSIKLPALDVISIKYNPSYEQVRPGQLPIMARDATRHEINHRRYHGFHGCPRTIDHHEIIVEVIAKVLQPKGYGDEDIRYLTNTLEDTILHDDLSEKFSLDGTTEFFSDVGRTHQGFTPLYDAHVKLNNYLWRGKDKRLRPYFTKDPETQQHIVKALQQFLERTGIAALQQEITIKGTPHTIKDRDAIRAFLNDETNWPTVAAIYAEEFSPLMQPSYAMPIFNHSGKGTKGREHETPEDEGNEFDHAMNKESYKTQRARKAWKHDTGIPPLMTPFETLDFVYQHLARGLRFNIQAFSESQQRPVHWYGKRDFDPERDTLKHLLVDIDDEGKIVIKKRPHSTSIDTPYKHAPRGFPETRFGILDTSGSMAYNTRNEGFSGRPINIGKTSVIPWGDESKYHYGILAWYGLIEYLKQNHLLNQTTIGLGNMSSNTIIARGLDNAKRNALTPQFGGTVLEASKLQDIFQGEGSLIFTTSDGEIENWDAIQKKFIQLARQHCYFHFQIGEPSTMATALQREGLCVIPILQAEDLTQKIINLTDQLYRGRT